MWRVPTTERLAVDVFGDLQAANKKISKQKLGDSRYV